MDREKFLTRGKSGGKWVVGYYAAFRDGSENIVHVIFTQDCRIDSCGADKRFRKVGAAVREVEPETVGRFSGIFDREGRRIFCGDFIEAEKPGSERKELMGVFESGGLFVAMDKTAELTALGEIGSERIEVVGNIYDDGKLLKEFNEKKERSEEAGDGE